MKKKDHAKGCPARKDLWSDCSCGADPDTWRACTQCDQKVLIDDLHHHGDDYDLCPKCSDEFVAHVDACVHEWDQEPVMDGYGELGRGCCRCGVFIDDHWASVRFPFICDGWVELPGADA